MSQDVDFCADIRRSARSAPANLAEGFGHDTHREFARYVSIARASLTETHNHLHDALESGYLAAAEHARLTELCERALKTTTKLHSYLKRTPNHRNRGT